MPEERNRVLIDRISDRIYAYQHEYKINGVREGLDPTKIVVVGNIIVDVLNRYREKIVFPEKFSVKKKGYALVDLHRHNHMTNRCLTEAIIEEIGRCTQSIGLDALFIEMPRMKLLNIKYPSNFKVIEPVGFFDYVGLEENAYVEYGDSGTSQEIATILGTPCVVVRDCTERPECHESGTCCLSSFSSVFDATMTVTNATRKEISLGDGKSSKRILDDVLTNPYNFGVAWYDYQRMRNFR
jgi:UDP-N-acetylglucosamine 2-epimerase (non-hydrolysing)